VRNLNSRQEQAVRYIDGPLLVLAGAGSGKTSVITRKIVYLIEKCGIKPGHIAAVTFTNKAAREMKERAGALLKGLPSRGLIVSTFHNLGMRIISKELPNLGLRPGFSIFDTTDSKALLRDLIEQEGLTQDSEDLETLQNRISGWKSEMQTPGRLLQLATSEGEQRYAKLYAGYTAALQAYNAVDFDDLILLPALLFRDNAQILQRWRDRIRYLLVDEYQDTNISQYQLVRLLTAERQALTVVGDDDQSIYAWRGARPENLAQLAEDYKDLKIIKLEQNYRSTSRILKAANTLIANNPHVFTKALWSEHGPGDEIRVIKTRNEESECETIVTELLDQKLKRGAHYRDFAVLYRGNHQSRLLELKLQAYQIPYKISGGTSFFARHEIKDAMSYLRLLANPDDDAAFLRIVNTPRREIGTVAITKLASLAQQNGSSLYGAISHASMPEHLGSRAAQALEGFHALIERTLQGVGQESGTQAIRQLFNESDYGSWLQQNSSSPKQAEKRMNNIWLLVDQVEKMLNRQDEPDEEPLTLQDAISRLILRDILDQQEEEDDSDRVHLLTLHASKGLEYPHVFIMGLEEEILPHRNSIEGETVEEERRLFYVGITRAKRSLHMTLCQTRKQFGEQMECIPSRFLDELPQEDLVWEGREKSDETRNRQKGRATLDALFKQLADDGL
jgi:ATP-dependent DNA helicase Rep